MTQKEVRQLKVRYAELTKWVRQAVSYQARYGKSGSLETRTKHQMRLAEVERELPVVEAKLREAWKV